MSVSDHNLLSKHFTNRANTIAALRKTAVQQPVRRMQTSTLDIAAGLAALFISALMLFPAQGLPGAAAGLREIIQSFAVPALLVICGIRFSEQAGQDWIDTISNVMAPFAFALLVWGAIVMAVGLTIEGWDLSQALLHSQLQSVSLLLLIPLFLAISKVLAFLRPASVLILAAAAEILHTNMGHFLIVEALRGAVFFFAGYYFARQAQDYARFAQNRPLLALAGVAIWIVFLAFIAFANHPLAHGQDITTLPFTSLGLGAAGAISVIMVAQLLAAAPVGAWFAMAGRYWIAVYNATAPIAAAMSGLTGFGSFTFINMELLVGAALVYVAIVALGFAMAPRKANPAAADQRSSGMYVRR